VSSVNAAPAVGGVPPATATAAVDARTMLLAELLRSHAAMIRSIIMRLVGRTADIEDLVQTTFVEALDSLKRYRRQASLSSWLGSIAVHVAQHYLRPHKRGRHLPLAALSEDDVCPEVMITRAAGADELIDRGRLAAKLEHGLRRIAPHKRSALLLHVMAGHSVAEIAMLMNATPTATRSRMFFARRELRKVIRSDPHFSELAEVVLPQGVRAKQ
jgi:RNA polymerase sigma-70 factor (ECF subfamily)